MMNRQRSIHPLLLVLVVASLFGVVGLACLADQALFNALDWPDAEREDWHRMFRVLGFVPLWFVVGLATALVLRPSDGYSRRSSPLAMGVYLALAPALAGLLAEPMKMILRRERPDADHVGYVFRAWSENTWSTAGLGLPSSHAAVAFAGAVALCVVAPRGAVLWMLLAAGCGFTRLADRAHWLSDVALAAALGGAVAWLLARLMRLRAGGR